jgi:uncharacterized membrane protein YhaH (DUF805 family)
MGFMEAVKSCFNRYVDFQGRSPRSEYWWFQLFIFLIIIVLMLIAGATGGVGGILLIIFYLAIILPSLAVTIRRFHDQDKSGWFILLGLIPAVGGLILLVFMCLKGTEGDNQFGPDPLGNVAERFD